MNLIENNKSIYLSKSYCQHCGKEIRYGQTKTLKYNVSEVLELCEICFNGFTKDHWAFDHDD
jgi:hypothetical protein